MEKRPLGLLKRDYNATLVRYNKMCKWIETASSEEQEKQFRNVLDVINDCNRLLNEIKAIDSLVTPGEIVNGFKS